MKPLDRLLIRLADYFRRPDRHDAATRTTLSPRRLEPRRMLDGGAAGLALTALETSLSPPTVQVSGDASSQPAAAPAANSSADSAANGANTAPSNIQFTPITAVDEDASASLLLTFDDPDATDAHQITIDWGDGSAPEVFNLSPGLQVFAAPHQYLDDSPTMTSSDVTPITVTIDDLNGGVATDATSVTVKNVDPSNVKIKPLGSVNEDGVVNLKGTFEDPGSIDSHTIEVDWGDGSPAQTYSVASGSRDFAATHKYLDDNPTGTTTDDYTVKVKVLDDDGGVAMNSATATVNNVAPSSVVISPLGTIDENGTANLSLGFVDPGSQDTHTVEVDWGDGSAVQTYNVTPGSRNFAASHQYLDDNPTATPADAYTVKVKVRDDDGGEAVGQADVKVLNVAPMNIVVAPPLSMADEGSLVTVNVSFADPGTVDTHPYTIDWGDGLVTTGVASGNAFSASHIYADNGTYLVNANVKDDDGGGGSGFAVVIINNVPPTLTVPQDQTVDEGALLSIVNIGTFTDPGFDNPLNTSNGNQTQETFFYSINWGDGTTNSFGTPTIDTPGGPGTPTSGSFDGSHTYADNGLYTVTVILIDDNAGFVSKTFSVDVKNVSPELTVVGDQVIDEGSLLSLTNLGTFTDPGFDNPLNVNDPSNGGETVETFAYTINWGDGTTTISGAATVDVPGSAGVKTAGSFDGSHTYADNGLYTVTVAVYDDDRGLAVKTFKVDVKNVAPELTVVGDQVIDEGSLLDLVNIGQITDVGFDNPLNVNDPANGGETVETFTYTINWGDGTAITAGSATIDLVGSPGVKTLASFNGSHTYADNGLYTVTVSILDDDGGAAAKTFKVDVKNVAPELVLPATQTIDEGSLLTLVDLGQIQDPGFDNPLNVNDPANGGETVETFTYTINWGDGKPIDSGSATVDLVGSPGVTTKASFDGAHTYADNGLYTVTVTVTDDDNGVTVRTFQVDVKNVAPDVKVVASQSVNEAQNLVIINIAEFTDPGFDNPLNVNDPANGGETVETFTYTIDWGDGDRFEPGDDPSVVNGVPTTDVFGSVGVKTAGSLDAQHTYVDNQHPYVNNGVYTVTVTISDDDGGVTVKTFSIEVKNINPTLFDLQPPQLELVATDVNTLGKTTVTGFFTDPGRDSYSLFIDWGDGLGPQVVTNDAQNVVAITPPTATSGLHQFTVTHTYLGPPDPLNPAADIPIVVRIHDDDFPTALHPELPPGQTGESNPVDRALTNPGIGKTVFRIDTTPRVPMIGFPPRQAVVVTMTSARGVVDSSRGGEVQGAGGESIIGAERYLELRVINPDGTMSEGYRLRPEVLGNLPALFRNLPDNHYAIYLVQAETNLRRLVIEVYVRNGKLIDPGDDSEGGRDRPPTDDASKKTPVPATPDADQPEANSEAESADAKAAQAPIRAGRPSAESHSTQQADDATLHAADDAAGSADMDIAPAPFRSQYSLVGAGALALGYDAARGEIDSALARAGRESWRRLRLAGHWRRKGRKPDVRSTSPN